MRVLDFADSWDDLQGLTGRQRAREALRATPIALDHRDGGGLLHALKDSGEPQPLPDGPEGGRMESAIADWAAETPGVVDPRGGLAIVFHEGLAD